MNVYELQTKRDEAYNAYNEVKKTILEDYNALAVALQVFSEDRQRVERRLGLHKQVMKKTVLQIAYRRTLKLASKFVWRLKRMRQIKKNGLHKLSRINPRKKVWDAWKMVKDNGVGITAIRSTRHVVEVVNRIVWKKLEDGFKKMQECGKERLLRLLAEQVVRMRREADNFNARSRSHSPVQSPRLEKKQSS